MLKIKKLLLDYTTYFILAFALYLMFCFIDRARTPYNFQVQQIIVEQGNGTGLIKQSMSGIPLDLKSAVVYAQPGDIIHVEYYLIRRRTGTVTSERVFEDSGNKSYTINSVSRTFSVGQLGIQRSTAEFRVPLFARTGCGAEIYTNNYYTFTYNILTILRPTIIETPRINVCVEGPPIKSIGLLIP